MSSADLFKYFSFDVDFESVEDRYNIFALLTLIPSFIYLLLLVGIPLIYTFYTSLHEASVLVTKGWVGLANYLELFGSPEFWNAFEFGIAFTVGSVILQLAVGLVLALLINQQFKGVFLARLTAIFPYLVPTVIVATIWQWLLNSSYGLVNGLGVHWGMLEESVAFFGDPKYVLPALVVSNSWRFTSFAVIIILARLQAIDSTLYEQAKVDGATRLQQFWTITLPNIRSAILLVILLRTLFMFNHFDIIWLLTRGGPFRESTNWPVFIFKKAFIDGNLAVGSSAAIILFVILLMFSTVYFVLFRPSREVETSL